MTTFILPVAGVPPNGKPPSDHPLPLIEDFPEGYPRYSALISSHPSLHVFRRFMRLRTRLLLNKQDKLAILERQLDDIDRKEARPLFLGNLRRDRNDDRKQILQQVDAALLEYDALLERNEKMISRLACRARDTTNLKNWTENTACLARDETKYLSCKDDLVALGASSNDYADNVLEAPVEDAIFWTKELMKIGTRSKVSDDPSIHIFPPNLVSGLARFTIAAVFILVLFAPMILLMNLQSTIQRLAVGFASCVVFIAVLCLVKTKITELFAAGAAYAAVLVVFIANNSPAQAQAP